MSEFADRVVLVTGAARGIGRSAAAQFADAGAVVAGADLDVEALEAVEKLSLRLGGDVGDTDDAHRIIDDTVAAFGRLDVLVNNAGAWLLKPTAEITPEEWDDQLSTNLRSFFLLTRRAAWANPTTWPTPSSFWPHPRRPTSPAQPSPSPAAPNSECPACSSGG